jgi:subtilisin family serine protease
LFVIAAGNDGEDFTAICDIRPACLDLPNIISVAALDRGEAGNYTLAGSGMESNYGRRVHVAAPGADILGLVNGNYLGLLSGTSQAAPQVAAVATLLRVIRPRAAPGDIKERLITCSRSVPMPASAADEDVNAIFGGIVDSTCTLMPEGEGMLQLKGSSEIYRVRLLVAVSHDLVFKPINDSSYDLIIPPRNLRGLRADSNPDEFTIFHKATEDRDASLSKDGRVRVWPDTQQLEVEVWDKTVNPPAWAQQKFSVNNVARFVAPMVKR